MCFSRLTILRKLKNCRTPLSQDMNPVLNTWLLRYMDTFEQASSPVPSLVPSPIFMHTPQLHYSGFPYRNLVFAPAGISNGADGIHHPKKMRVGAGDAFGTPCPHKERVEQKPFQNNRLDDSSGWVKEVGVNQRCSKTSLLCTVFACCVAAFPRSPKAPKCVNMWRPVIFQLYVTLFLSPPHPGFPPHTSNSSRGH